MQPNEIVIDVDQLNDGNTTPETYERIEENLNRSTYAGTAHTLESRDTINMYRSSPTKSGNFKGVAKTSVKLSKDFTVLGVDGVSNLTAPLIIEVSFSIPVGVSDAEVLVCRQRALGLLDNDLVMDKLNGRLIV